MISANIKNFLSYSQDKICEHFSLNLSQKHFEITIAVIRIAFGLLMLHRFYDIKGFIVIADSPIQSYIDLNTSLGIFFSLMIIFGVFTPIAILFLLFNCLAFPNYAGGLFNQVACICSWGLLFFGAGRAFSLDSYLKEIEFLKTALGKVYSFVPKFSKENIALTRFVLLMMFWGICVSAMMAHFYDSFWREGKVLQLLLTTPYLCDHYLFFQLIADKFPMLWNLGCKFGLIVQAVWEFFLIPLMFFRWGRVFVAIQGFAFFIISVFFINLGTLPATEFIMWSMLFAYPVCFKLNQKSVETGQEEETERRSNYTIRAFVIFTSCIVILFMGLRSYSVVFKSDLMNKFVEKPWIHKLFVTLAQERIGVFNLADLGMGAVNFVLYEMNQDKEPIRVVPFQDRYGGRLEYLKNDYLYFDFSVGWQRTQNSGEEGTNKFVDDKFIKPTKRTKRLIVKVAILDACINAKSGTKTYGIEVYNKELDDKGLFYAWTEPKVISRSWVAVDLDLMRQKNPYCELAYELGPGHYRSKERAIETLDHYHELKKQI